MFFTFHRQILNFNYSAFLTFSIDQPRGELGICLLVHLQTFSRLRID